MISSSVKRKREEPYFIPVEQAKSVVEEIFSRANELVRPAAALVLAHRRICWNDYGMSLSLQMDSGYKLKVKEVTLSKMFFPELDWKIQIAFAYYLCGAKAAFQLMKKRFYSQGILKIDDASPALHQIAKFGPSQNWFTPDISDSYFGIRWITFLCLGKGRCLWIEADKREEIKIKELNGRVQSLNWDTKYLHFEHSISCLPEKVDDNLVPKGIKMSYGIKPTATGSVELNFPQEPDWKKVAERVQPFAIKVLQKIHQFAREPYNDYFPYLLVTWTSCSYTANALFNLFPANGLVHDFAPIDTLKKNEDLAQNNLFSYTVSFGGKISLSTGDDLHLGHVFYILQYPSHNGVRYLVCQSFIDMYRLIDWLQFCDGSYSKERFWNDFWLPFLKFEEPDADPKEFAEFFLKNFLGPNHLQLPANAIATFERKESIRLCYKQIKEN